MQNKREASSEKPEANQINGCEEMVITTESINTSDSFQPNYGNLAEEAALAETEARVEDDITGMDDAALAELEAQEAEEAEAIAAGFADLPALDKVLEIVRGRRVPVAVWETEVVELWARACSDAERATLRKSPRIVSERLMGCVDLVTQAQNIVAREDWDERRIDDPNARRPAPARPRTTLPKPVLAAAFAELNIVVQVRARPDASTGIIMVYCDDPESPTWGIYVAARRTFEDFAWKVGGETLTSPEVSAMFATLRTRARLVSQTEGDFIPMANGVWSYPNQVLYDFSPDFVFLSKCATAYRPCENPVIQKGDGTWDIESSLRELACGDEEVLALYWQVIGAALRATHPWGKVIVFYGPRGNNGKSTLLTMIESLVGASNVANLDLAGLSERFGLDQLLPDSGASPRLIISHENDESYLPRIGSLKKLATHDPVRVEVKGQRNENLQWKGLILQGLNEFVRTKELNTSVTRRFVLIPFMAEMIRAENSGRVKPGQIISDERVITDYVKRQEVLEYVAYRALNIDKTPFYDHLSQPAAVAQLLHEQTVSVDTVADFWDNFEYEFSWDCLPTKFLFDLYKSWLPRTSPGAHPVGERVFQRRLKVIVEGSHAWRWTDHPFSAQGIEGVREYTMMDYPDLRDIWGDWRGDDKKERCCPGDRTLSNPATGAYRRYRGVVRK